MPVSHKVENCLDCYIHQFCLPILLILLVLLLILLLVLHVFFIVVNDKKIKYFCKIL